MPLAGVATLLVAAAIAAPHATPQRAQASNLAARAVLSEINGVRSSHSLRPLRLSSPLTAAADQDSREMGARGYFEHSSADGTSFWKRVGRYYGSNGYRYWSVGENLLWSTGTLTPAAAVTMWMNGLPSFQNVVPGRTTQVGGEGPADCAL